jgi:5-methylcytosine-specific restriction endonuclease McrA
VSGDAELGSPAWKRLRLFVLARDGGRCRIRGPRCKEWATEVDHVVARADGGDTWNPDNLRAACRPCNSAGGAEVGNRRRWRYSTTEPEYETRF